MSKKLEAIKTVTFERLSATTFHGIPHLCREKIIILKVIWILFILSSICACAYFVTKTTLNYLNHDIVTNVNVIYELQSQFPAVSVCSSIGFTNETILLKSQFNLNVIEYYKWQDSYYKECYRFNAGINLLGEPIDIYNSTGAGYRFGLELDFLIKLPNTSDYGELIIYIHNYTSNPSTLKNKGFKITAGSVNYFQIDRTFIDKLSEPFGDCLDDISLFKYNRTLIDYISQTNTSYSYEECIRLCKNLFIIEQSSCNCTTTDIGDVESKCFYDYKTDNPLRRCFKNFEKKFQKNGIEMCLNYCPLECDSVNFSINTYAEQLPVTGVTASFQYSKYFQTFEEVKLNFYSVKVFYADLRYTVVTEQLKMELFDFVSNIGGTMGVFLGVSFLSFIEIFENLLEVFYILLCLENT